MGASVVNALSRWTTVDVFHDFKHYQARFESVTDPATGKITAGHTVQPLKQLGNTRQRGSLIRFLPDDRVFETIQFNHDVVCRRLRELAYLNKGLAITFTDERIPEKPAQPAEADADAAEETAENAASAPQRTQTFLFEGGILDYVKYLNEEKTPLHEEPIYIEGKREDVIFRAAIQYTDSYTENVFSYVNNIPTGEGGSHETLQGRLYQGDE